MTEEEISEVRERRLALMEGLWNYFVKTDFFDKKEVMLSLPLVNEVIEHYCTDCVVIKFRYKIPERIERTKIAGLIVALIMRYRPICLISDTFKTDEALYANEILAIIYGLSVCCEDSIKNTLEIMKKPWFKKWFDDFKYLLHVRHYTAESLTFIFKTLLIALGQKNESAIAG